MQLILFVIVICLSFGIVATIRVGIKQRDVEYIAETYNADLEPQDFNYGALQVQRVAVNSRRRLIYAIGLGRLSVLGILRNRTLQLLHTETSVEFEYKSIQLCKGFISVAARSDEGMNDRILVFREYSSRTPGALQLEQSIDVGEGPGHHVLTRNCRRLVVIRETSKSLAVVDFGQARFENPVVKPLLFEGFDDQEERLIKEAFINPDGAFAESFDPNWICLNSRGTKAYVSLYTNNAIATVDLRRGQERIKALTGLGLKDWSDGGGTRGFDFTNTLRTAELKNRPVFSTFNPTQISCTTAKKKDYIFLAGTGIPLETPLRSVEFEDFFGSISGSKELGDLYVYGPMPLNDQNMDDVLEKLINAGSRGFAALTGKPLSMVAETGSSLEFNTMNSVLFNGKLGAIYKVLGQFDKLSVKMGMEPELVISKQVCGGRYIVMIGGATQPGLLFVFTLDTFNVQEGFVFQDMVDGYIREDSVFNDEQLYEKELVSLREPKGLAFVSGRHFGGKTMIVSGSQITSSVELFELRIDCKAAPPEEVTVPTPLPE